MQVKAIMQSNVRSVKKGTTLGQLLVSFKDFHSFPVVPVVDSEQVLVGTVHIRSFFEIFQPHNQDLLMRNPLSMISREPTDIFNLDIEAEMGFLIIMADIMDTKVVKIEQSADLRKAYDLMQLHGKTAIPVVDDNKRLVGIVSIFDIVMKIFHEKGLI
ncbi:MAG: CBS domain-containing protein [Candidatus Omnitrophica bacterium]|nr:CBS domain-containing protein [Candidatus Omnitrophota bacterium]